MTGTAACGKQRKDARATLLIGARSWRAALWAACGWESTSEMKAEEE
jgi:uncharacterized ferredoxin-like protein